MKTFNVRCVELNNLAESEEDKNMVARIRGNTYHIEPGQTDFLNNVISSARFFNPDIMVGYNDDILRSLNASAQKTVEFIKSKYSDDDDRIPEWLKKAIRGTITTLALMYFLKNLIGM